MLPEKPNHQETNRENFYDQHLNDRFNEKIEIVYDY